MIVSCPSCQRNYVVADEQIAGKQFRARCKSCGVEFRLDGVQARDASAASDKDEPAKFMSATEAFLALQSAPPPGAGTWSICLSKTDTRRMTTEEVIQAHNKGTFGTDVFVWKSGMQKWVRFSEVPELMAAIGKPLSKIPTNAAGGVTDTSPSAPPSEPPTRPGVSSFPGKGTKSSRPARAATLMGTGVPLTPGASVPPRSGLNTPPPPPPEVMARASTRPQPNGKQSEPHASKGGASAVPRPSAVSSSPSPQSEKATGDKLIPKAPQVGAKSDSAASKAESPARKPNTPSIAPRPDSLRPRKSPPAPANHELEIVVEVDAAPGTPAAANANGAVVLPPLKGAESQTAVAESIAAAGSLATTTQKSELPKAKAVEEKVEARGASAPLGDKTASDVDTGSSRSELGGAAGVESAGSDIEAKPGSGDTKLAGGASNSGATETSSRQAESSHKPAEPDDPVSVEDRESYPPLKPRKKTRVAGMVLSMAVVGLVGVLGGVAGAVYIMKGASNSSSPASSVVALQPQPATPASVATNAPEPAVAASVASAEAKAPETSAGDSDNTEASTRHSRAHRNDSAAKVGIAAVSKATPAKASAPPPNTQTAAAAAAAAPAPAATNPFNRESALAVLGFAASRAPTCKKPDGPKGSGRVQVTFDPSGAVVAASVVGAPIAGTAVAQCVASIFRKVRVPPFAGDRVTIPKDFTIPP